MCVWNCWSNKLTIAAFFIATRASYMAGWGATKQRKSTAAVHKVHNNFSPGIDIVGAAPECLTELCRPVSSSSGRQSLRSASHGDLIVSRFCINLHIWELVQVFYHWMPFQVNLLFSRLLRHA